MSKRDNFRSLHIIPALLSAFLVMSLLFPASVLRVSAAEAPAAWSEHAGKHVPMNLRITLHGIEKRDGYSVVTGTAQWDDDDEITECEFNPAVLVGGSYARPKCTAWTLVKRSGSAGEQQGAPDDVLYDAENGVCTKKFELMFVDENEEIEVSEEGSGERYANGVKMGSQLKFTMTSVVSLDGYTGESPECDAVEFTLSEDTFGKTFPENGGTADGGACKWCGETHEGFFGSILGFFHDVFYFFAHLFD